MGALERTLICIDKLRNIIFYLGYNLINYLTRRSNYEHCHNNMCVY